MINTFAKKTRQQPNVIGLGALLKVLRSLALTDDSRYALAPDTSQGRLGRGSYRL